MRIEPGLLEDGRRIVDDGIDAAELLQREQADAHHQGRTHALGQQVAPFCRGSVLRLGIGGQDLAEFALDAGIRGRYATQARQRLVRRLAAAMGRQPARRIGEEQHAHEQGQAGHRPQEEHRAPVVAEDVVDDVRAQDAQRHGQLVDRDQHAALARGGALGNVQGRHERGDPDGETEQQARGAEHPDGRDQAGRHRPENEQHGRGQQRGAPAEALGGIARGDRAEQRAQRHGGRHQPLGAGRDGECVAQEAERAGDDPFVESEQDAGQPRDDRDEVDHDRTPAATLRIARTMSSTSSSVRQDAMVSNAPFACRASQRGSAPAR